MFVVAFTHGSALTLSTKHRLGKQPPTISLGVFSFKYDSNKRSNRLAQSSDWLAIHK